MGKKKPAAKSIKPGTWEQKETVTLDYIKWFITHQSGDALLASTLAQQWQKGWHLILRHFRKGATSEEVAKLLKAKGYNTILLAKGLSKFNLPGRTVTFLILNREEGCKQITLERWTANAKKTTNMVLIGMGQKDISQAAIAEKQIHLCAFELPKAGDYLNITTQSISPIVKGIIVFVGATLLAGCTDKPATPPPPLPPPSIPKDPTGNPGPHQVTTDGENLPDNGIQLPTGRNGQPRNEPHTQRGIKTNITPDIPSAHWYWFWLFTINVARFKSGCCFYILVNKKVWLNGAESETGWHNDNPLPGNIWVDANGLHIVDSPGYPPNGPNPPPYNAEAGLGQLVGPNDHFIVTLLFRLFVWCPGEEAHEYTFSKTLEIDHGTLKNGTSFEKPKFVGKRPVTDDDRRQAICP